MKFQPPRSWFEEKELDIDAGLVDSSLIEVFFQPKKLKLDFTKIEIFGFDFNNRFYQIL